jgi:hypothetical protein
MNKLIFLFITLLLISVVGCSSADSVTGPDTSDQIQTDNTVQKPDATPGDPKTGVMNPGDPGNGIGPH